MIDFFFCLGEGWMTLSGVGVLLFPLLTVDDEDVLRFLVGPEILYTKIRIENQLYSSKNEKKTDMIVND